MKNEPIYSDEQLIEMIRGDEAARNRAMAYVYKNNYESAKGVLKSQYPAMSMKDIEEVYHYAIEKLDRKVRMTNFKLTGTLSGYLINTCKGNSYSRWRTKMRDRDRYEKVANNKVQEITATEPFEQFHIEEVEREFEKCLSSLDEKCQQVLRLYRRNYKTKEIVTLVDFSSEGSVREKASRCRKLLKGIMAESVYFRDFFKR